MSVKSIFTTCICVASTVGVTASAVSDVECAPETKVSTQYYGVSRYDVTPVLPALRRIASFADSLYRAGALEKVGVTGTASADGPYELNARLARNRAEAVTEWIRRNKGIPAGLIEMNTYLGTWSDVGNMLRATGSVYASSPYSSLVIEAIDEGGTPHEVQERLKALAGGRAWEWLAAEVLPSQRTTVVDVSGRDSSLTAVLSESRGSEPYMSADKDESEPKDDCYELLEGEEVCLSAEEVWHRGLYVKTNMPAWALLWTNVALEVDMGRHWSFVLPVYYSGFNYFSGKTKFRTLTLQPEVRWWVGDDNTGFFAGAHFGLGWYNCAFGGANRYQDHDRRTPAIGGGVAVGYRFHFCSNKRWQMEASLGAGVYRLDYDVFENRHNGLVTDRRKRTFYGIDQAAFTISYRFDLCGKGGER